MLAALTLLLTLPALALAADFAVVRGGRLNLRQYPSSSSQSLGKYNSGSWVDVQGQSASGWYAVRTMDGKTGYMAGNYLTFAQSGSIGTVAYANGGYVNLRRGPSSAYGSIGSLKSGTRVTVLLKGNGWYQITGGGLTGFMSAGYLSNMGTTGGGSGTVTTRTAYVNNPRSTQVLYLRETPSQRARALGQYKNGTQVKVVSYGATWCEVYVGTRHGYMMTRYLSFNSHYVTPTPEVIYVTPAPTPQIVYVTPTPTPLVQYITPKPAVPGAPESGTTITLAAAYGSASNTINVYYDQGMTSVRATYTGGKQATLLKYDTNVCMILVDGVVAYVSTWNVNY